MDFTPTRPTAAASSMWAIPATRVAKTRGAMIILIMRRKRVVITDRPSAKAEACSGDRKLWAAQPARTPVTMAAITKMLNRRMAFLRGRIPYCFGHKLARRPSCAALPLGIRPATGYDAA